ncbi:Longin-like domain-containing protein [Mycena galericulata]|nr:Longin-like domain-containing protein [Mycena galericulata]
MYALPTERQLWTVLLRCPFVHKKAQENFKRKYLRWHTMGVGMRCVKWERMALSSENLALRQRSWPSSARCSTAAGTASGGPSSRRPASLSGYGPATFSCDKEWGQAEGLIQRSYCDDVPPSYVEPFLLLVLDIEEEGHQGINYMDIRHSNLYFLALSKRNSNAAEIFLHRLTQVLVEYFKELEEESIRDNFVIIYELMDEMMDFGYPRPPRARFFKSLFRLCFFRGPHERARVFRYITQESHKLEIQARSPPQ